MVRRYERLTPAIGATVLDPRVPAALVEGDDPPTVDAVHAALSAGLRTELEQMSAVHDLGAFRSSSWLDGGQQALDEAIARTGVAVHPIIARLPFTGRPYLNVSESFTRWVIWDNRGTQHYAVADSCHTTA